MLYLIVDPIIFLLQDSHLKNAQVIDQFLGFLVEWARAADEYDIEFGISKACIAALKKSRSSVFNHAFIEQLMERLPQFNTEDIYTAVSPLIERLQSQDYLDEVINKIDSNILLYEMESVILAPTDYLKRLAYQRLEDTFLEMLGAVVFARNQQIFPLSEFANIRLLTHYSDMERKDWAAITDYTIALHVHFSLALASSVPNYQNLQTQREMKDAFQTISSSSTLKNIVGSRQLKSVQDALNAAYQVYPKQFILTDEARDTARHSAYPDPIKIYRALRGLVEVWLRVYERDGDFEANRLYYEKVNFKISTEAEQVTINPKFRHEREATFDGKTIFAQRHVKLGTGPNSARIHFHVVEDGGLKKILLARSGIHAPTARFAH